MKVLFSSIALIALLLSATVVAAGDGKDGTAGPARLGEGESLVVVKKVQPTYPEEARQDKVVGMVVLELVIKADGTVGSTTVVEDPDPRLTAAAIAAVEQWQFKPYRDDSGTACEVLYRVTLNFSLK